MLLNLRLEPDVPLRRIEEPNIEEGEIFESDEEKREKQEEENEFIEYYDIPQERKDIFILTKGVPIPPLLKEETQEKAKDYREKYHDSPEHNWLQKFMKNTNYSIIDNEGEGDCLFATIRDAFSSISQQTSVHKLRKKLSEEATDNIFMNYKEQYDMYNASILSDTNKIKELEAQYQSIKQKFANTIDRNEQKVLSENAKKIKAEHDKLVEEKKVSAQILKEFKFMKGVDTLEKFKTKIKHCDFWADTWAISTLERILNIKFILLSSESYKNGDISNVLQCGQLNDIILQNKGIFNPEFYIIVDHTGNHYKTIGYKKKMIFKFSEIPYDIKKMVTDKCLEKNAGPFDLIPDFQKLKTGKKKGGGDENFEELTEAKLRGLYDDDIEFVFYHKSLNKIPGKGPGEKIPNNIIKEYNDLAIIPEWRKKLDNFWVAPFVLDGIEWQSVENYYQASKFKKVNPQFYLSLSLKSGTDISRDPILAKGAGSKSGKYKGKLLRPIEVQIDPDFYGPRHKKELQDALYAKFTRKENEDLKELLLATKDAKLTHYLRGKEPKICNELMLVRHKIKQKEM